VDGIDDTPGQPGLRLRDTFVEVNGTSLKELEPDDAEQRFADLLGDGAVVLVEPHVELIGMLTSENPFDQEALQGDLTRFSGDWGVQLQVQPGNGPCHGRVILEGTQSAVKAAKAELENLMQFYVNT